MNMLKIGLHYKREAQPVDTKLKNLVLIHPKVETEDCSIDISFQKWGEA
jgi:hypothetical protein